MSRAFNVPNTLTLFRILLIPVFAVSLAKGDYKLALTSFTLAAVTDALDGFTARRFNQQTLVGTVLDPLADKLLVATAFVALGVLKLIPLWLLAIVITRDVIIAIGMGLFAMKHISVELKPSLVSKCTTTFQLLTIVFALAALVWHLSWPQKWVWVITGLFTIVSGAHYIYISMSYLNDETALSQE